MNWLIKISEMANIYEQAETIVRQDFSGYPELISLIVDPIFDLSIEDPDQLENQWHDPRQLVAFVIQVDVLNIRQSELGDLKELGQDFSRRELAKLMRWKKTNIQYFDPRW